MESTGKAEYDRLMSELRAGMASPERESGSRTFSASPAVNAACALALAAFVLGLAAVLAPGEHATYWASLWHCCEFITGIGLCALFGVYCKWRSAAVARNQARQRR
jgi:hypothetical protein